MNKLFVISLCFFFAGCAGMNDDFACKKTATDACMNMKDANDMASRGGDLDSLLEQKKNSLTAGTPEQTNSANTVQVSTELSTKSLTTTDPLQSGKVARIPEERTNVWIAPYYDKDSTYHHATYIEFISRSASWDK